MSDVSEDKLQQVEKAQQPATTAVRPRPALTYRTRDLLAGGGLSSAVSETKDDLAAALA